MRTYKFAIAAVAGFSIAPVAVSAQDAQTTAPDTMEAPMTADTMSSMTPDPYR